MLKYGNKELALLQDAYYECNYQYNSSSKDEWYEATAADTDGNKYKVYWAIDEDYAKRDKLIQAAQDWTSTSGDKDYMSDDVIDLCGGLTEEEIEEIANDEMREEDACDWDNPWKIVPY